MRHELTPILLVGSIPLADENEVFQTCAAVLGHRIGSIPDGETGPRTNWINWQREVMERAPMLQRQSHEDGYGAVQVDLYEIRPNLRGAREFPPLGYAEAAMASYRTFDTLVRDGVLDPQARMQVALPTPFAPMMAFVAPAAFAEVEPLYLEAMQRELQEILAVVPAEKLAVQWDVALEFAALEGVFPSPVGDFDSLTGRLAELTNWVPDEVSLGFHLCYGDAGHQHFKEPADTGLMVDVIERLVSSSRRPIDWFHLPVPIDRDDDGYFAPLSGLALDATTTLYLGLVHARDGVDGALRRAASARQYVERFGIATECGLGRRSRSSVGELLQLQADVARALD